MQDEIKVIPEDESLGVLCGMCSVHFTVSGHIPHRTVCECGNEIDLRYSRAILHAKE